jgi:hypothetical protein
VSAKENPVDAAIFETPKDYRAMARAGTGAAPNP